MDDNLKHGRNTAYSDCEAFTFPQFINGNTKWFVSFKDKEGVVQINAHRGPYPTLKEAEKIANRHNNE